MFWQPSVFYGDDTPVPVLAKGKTDKAGFGSTSATTGPFGGSAPPAAIPVLAQSPWRASAAAPGRMGRRARPMPTRASGPCTRPIARRAQDRGAMLGPMAGGKFFELADIAANTRRGKDVKPISFWRSRR